MILFRIVANYKMIFARKNWKYFPEILRVKWVDGECKHVCLVCKYADMCYNNLDDLGGFRK